MDFSIALQQIFTEHKDKRICVLATTCAGKTTLLKQLPDCLDMDKLVFPTLTKDEHDFVCQDPWTDEVGSMMNRLVRERVKIEKGHPVFGTVMIDCDIIVYLDIENKILAERATKRGAKLESVLNMKNAIEKEITKAKVPVIKLMMV